MANGMLELDGSLELDQYWPIRGSDADTTKVKVSITGGFRFRPHPDAPFTATRAFEGAKVRGFANYDAIVNNSVTVRLQGIDAPELHYRPAAAIAKRVDRTAEQHAAYLEWNHDYRQRLAETATVALAEFLAKLGPGPLPCTVRTAVDEPGDVFDTYGRFVGDIHVRDGAGEINVNHWLVEQGWAFPAFYASMTAAEIGAFTDHAMTAWENGAGVWAEYSGTARTAAFDWNLRYRRPTKTHRPQPDPAADGGDVMLPKLFRRLSTYLVNRKAGMVSGTFESYLRAKRDSDTVHWTADFLAQGPAAAPVLFFDAFIAGGNFTVWPEDIVFREKPSSVVGPDGRAVRW